MHMHMSHVHAHTHVHVHVHVYVHNAYAYMQARVDPSAFHQRTTSSAHGRRSLPNHAAWMVKRREIGGFGGG